MVARDLQQCRSRATGYLCPGPGAAGETPRHTDDTPHSTSVGSDRDPQLDVWHPSRCRFAIRGVRFPPDREQLVAFTGQMRSPVEVLESFYRAEAVYVASGGADGGDFRGLARCLHPDVVVHQTTGLPFGGAGEWRGHRGVQAWMDAFAGTWRSMRVERSRVVTDGDVVVVLLDVAFESRATGRALTTSLVQVNKFTGDRIVEIRPYYWDPAAVSDVCRPRSGSGTGRRGIAAAGGPKDR